MNWSISHKISSVTFAPLQPGFLTNIRIKNLTKNRMVVTKYYLYFDWMGTYVYPKETIIKIGPNKSQDLPDLHFTIDLSAPKGPHKYKMGIAYQLLENGEWKEYREEEPAGDFIEIKSLPQKNYSVFISHSNSKLDKKFVDECNKAMKSCGITGYFAEQDIQPTSIMWNKIENKIKKSDAFLLLWTEDAKKSGDVREEIGMAVGFNKKDKIIAIVQNGIDVDGSIKALGKEWIDYHPPNHTHSLHDALKSIIQWAIQKEEDTSRIQKLDGERRRSRRRT